MSVFWVGGCKVCMWKIATQSIEIYEMNSLHYYFAELRISHMTNITHYNTTSGFFLVIPPISYSYRSIKITRSRHKCLPSTWNSILLVSITTYNSINIRYLHPKKIFNSIYSRMLPGRDGRSITTKFIIIHVIPSISTW